MEKATKPKKPVSPPLEEESYEEEESEEAAPNRKLYDPLDYGSESEERPKPSKKHHKRKAEIGYGGKRYVYYEDRSE